MSISSSKNRKSFTLMQERVPASFMGDSPAFTRIRTVDAEFQCGQARVLDKHSVDVSIPRGDGFFKVYRVTREKIREWC